MPTTARSGMAHGDLEHRAHLPLHVVLEVGDELAALGQLRRDPAPPLPDGGRALRALQARDGGDDGKRHVQTVEQRHQACVGDLLHVVEPVAAVRLHAQVRQNGPCGCNGRSSNPFSLWAWFLGGPAGSRTQIVGL